MNQEQTTEKNDSPVEAKLVQVNELLDLAVKLRASDIHLAEGQPIIYRLSGKLTKIEGIDMLSREQMEHIVFKMAGKANADHIYALKDFDLSYIHNDGNVFRMNIFFKRGKLSAALRLIENKVKTLEELTLPTLCQKFVRQKQGLVLITGPTGSGKTTSLSAMIEWINQRFNYHIITIEDPIEVMFTPAKSIFSQRELNEDTLTMGNALKSVLRQDPDIVVIAEMRDPDTISAAISIAETGHLVFGTLHTSGAGQTINRISTAFPPSQQQQILDKLADSLVGVMSQRLVSKIGGGRVPLFEIFENTPAVAHLIRSGDTIQLKNLMTTGSKQGMFTMEKYAEDLINKGVIDKEEVQWLFEEDDEEETKR